MSNLVEDLVKVTTIQKATLDRLCNISIDCIGHSLYESINNSDNITEITLGIGTLLMKLEDDSISYKFIPSNKLENTLIDVAQKKESPLTKAVEKSIVDKIEKTYKDLL